MKNIRKTILSSASVVILGIGSIANAAEVTTTAEIQTVVIEPTQLNASYTPTGNLTTGHMEKGTIFGNLMIDGYKVTATFGDLKLSDSKGGSNLTLTDVMNPANTLDYTVVYEGAVGDIYPIINNNASNNPTEPLPVNNMLMSVRLASTQNNVPAGQYSGMLNISISNQ